MTIQGLGLKPILLKHNIRTKLKFEAILIDYRVENGCKGGVYERVKL
jgi:hypothetical protein